MAVTQVTKAEDIMGVLTDTRMTSILVSFFVWCSEVEHETYQTCECGKLCKKIIIYEKYILPVYKFVCINRSNKYHPGCKVYLDV